MGKRQEKRLAAYNAKLEADKVEREKLQGRKRDKERLQKEQTKAERDSRATVGPLTFAKALPPRVQQPRQQTDAPPPVEEAAPAGAHAAAPQQQTQQADTARSEASTIVTQGGTVVKRHMQPTDDQWNIFAKYQTKLHEDAKKVEQAARRHKEKSLRDRLDAQLKEKHALKVQEKRMNWEKEQRILKNDRAAKQALLDQEQARRLKDIENFEYAKQAAVEAEEAKRQAREREREEGRQRADLTLTQP